MFKKNGRAQTVEEVVLRNLEEMPYEREPEILYLKKAVELLNKEVSLGKKVTIIGDYDCDGIMASVIMSNGIYKKFGFRPNIRLPKRFSEGYGLSETIIDEIDSGLVITVDNGIAAIEAVKKAKEKGLSVIITDHHLPVVEKGCVLLPPADMIVDPFLYEDSSYTGYCGAGLAYRFVKELLPETACLYDAEVFAMIATIADVMDITKANHDLVKKGLTLLNKGLVTPAIRELIRQCNFQEDITETDIGFTVAPIINAASRLHDDGASKVVEILLSTHKEARLPWMVSSLISNNEKRKALVKEAMESITLPKDKKSNVVYKKGLSEGIIGLIAGRLCEETDRPVIVFTDAKEKGYLKGSGRSVEGIHLLHKLQQTSKFLVKYGGHKGAAGMTIKTSDFEAFTKAFQKECGNIPKKKRIRYDLELSPFLVDETKAELRKFAPYGKANPQPTFHCICVLSNIKRLGDGSHFIADAKGTSISLIAFGKWERYFKMGQPEKVELVGTLSRGEKTQVEIIDFLPA